MGSQFVVKRKMTHRSGSSSSALLSNYDESFSVGLGPEVRAEHAIEPENIVWGGVRDEPTYTVIASHALRLAVRG